MTTNEQMAKALQQFEPRIYNRKPKAHKTFTERLAIVCAKAAIYGYLALTIYAAGYFSTIYSDGILFEIEGIVSYWVDFGGAE